MGKRKRVRIEQSGDVRCRFCSKCFRDGQAKLVTFAAMPSAAVAARSCAAKTPAKCSSGPLRPSWLDRSTKGRIEVYGNDWTFIIFKLFGGQKWKHLYVYFFFHFACTNLYIMLNWRVGYNSSPSSPITTNPSSSLSADSFFFFFLFLISPPVRRPK